ncbi:F-box/LRR-repeat protein 6 [Eurosta solidaginis]|uniref:F-box/LRR-repeat protein 6 n=1 Tax=Eurosta solidaginis TaxID=178769 RepID=UPI00353171D7
MEIEHISASPSNSSDDTAIQQQQRESQISIVPKDISKVSNDGENKSKQKNNKAKAEPREGKTRHMLYNNAGTENPLSGTCATEDTRDYNIADSLSKPLKSKTNIASGSVKTNHAKKNNKHEVNAAASNKEPDCTANIWKEPKGTAIDTNALITLNNSQHTAGVDNDEGEDDDSQKEDTSMASDNIDNSRSPLIQSQTPPIRQPAPRKTEQATTKSASIMQAMGVAASIVVAAAGINATIPDTIISPPKSDTTQTDDANTATSSSPASDSQLSPGAVVGARVTGSEVLASAAILQVATENTQKSGAIATNDTASKSATKRSASASSSAVKNDEDAGGGGKRVVQPINVIANGTIPKSSGKPHMLAMNKKLKEKAARTPRQRKQKPIVPIYESELSDNKTGIKLCIKKSDSSGNLSASAGAATPPMTGVRSTSSASNAASTASGKQTSRKRSRKAKSKARLDSDESDIELTSGGKRGKKDKSVGQKKVSATSVEEQGEKYRASVEQGDWGARIPQEILYKIFEILIDREGCLPTLCRLGRVCSLWRNVSLTPTLWKSMDLSAWIKEKYRTELKLKWFVDNRCSECTDLNVANWKMTDINCFLNKLAVGCPNITSITLSGWKNFTCDHLAYLTENMQKLQRLDLSSVNVEMNASKSAVGPQSLCNALQTMNGRLTHIYLAHNRLAGIPQIVTTLATHCPNLLNLDLSNVTTQATSHGILHIEKLQHGCPKLKVLRVTNSHITWSNASLQETMDSPGFPDLEELSVAALTDESRVIGDDHLQRILKTSSKLKLLDVRGCARLTHESLIRLPAWDIKHLYLSGCSVTRDGSGLELIASKWAHSLIELDLAWANVQQPLDNALRALAEKGNESPLAHLNLCGSSVSDDAVKEILANCVHMSSINLASCRGLPRGVKRLMQGQQELQELREVLKVQMKFKLPAQIKHEQEEERRQRAKESGAIAADGDSGGGDGSVGNSQTN